MKAMLLCRLAALALLVGCSAPAAPPRTVTPTIGSSKELQALMKEQVNPTFSKLTFLAFHAEEMEDTVSARRQMAEQATRLSSAFARLRDFRTPPTQTPEGREVFFAYAQAVDGYAQKLVGAVATNAEADVQKHLESISKTCNDCHHFFRLDIEDSVVGPGAAQ